MYFGDLTEVDSRMELLTQLVIFLLAPRFSCVRAGRRPRGLMLQNFHCRKDRANYLRVLVRGVLWKSAATDWVNPIS